MDYPVISADSHITEHPDTYIAHIDAAWKDKAPKMVDGGERGDVFVIDGMDTPIAMGLVAAAGKPPEELTAVDHFRRLVFPGGSGRCCSRRSPTPATIRDSRT